MTFSPDQSALARLAPSRSLLRFDRFPFAAELSILAATRKRRKTAPSQNGRSLPPTASSVAVLPEPLPPASEAASTEPPAPPRRTGPWWIHAALVALICLVVAYDFFVVGRYLELPYNHEVLCDCDPIVAAQILLFVNDGDAFIFHHPGATLFSLQAGLVRTLALVNGDVREVLDLPQVRSLADVERLLTTVIAVGRVQALLLYFLMTALLYAALLALTRRWWIAFIFTAFIMTTPAAMYQSRVARTELVSLVCIFLAIFLWLAATRRMGEPWRTSRLLWGLCGLAIGLAVLAKIQVIPPILFLVLGGIVLLWRQGSRLRIDRRELWINAAVPIACLLVTPYWALSKPSFLTPSVVIQMREYLQPMYGLAPNLTAGYDRTRLQAAELEKLVSGMPSTFLPLVLLALLGLLGGALALIVLQHRLPVGRLAQFYAISQAVNLIVLGAILGLYLLLIPTSVSFEGYVANTHHMVYTTLTGATRGGQAENVTGDVLSKLQSIIVAHNRWDSILGHSPLLLVVIVAGISLFRLAAPRQPREAGYAGVLLLFLLGFLMDILASLRWIVYYVNYVIYALIPYGAGMAYFAALELSTAGVRRLRGFFGYLLCALIAIQAVVGVQYMLAGGFGQVGQPIDAELIWGRLQDQVTQLDSVVEWTAKRDEHQAKSCLRPRRGTDLRGEIAQRIRPPLAYWDFAPAGGGPYPRFDALQRAAVLAASGALPETVTDLTISVVVKILERPAISSSYGETLLFGSPDFQAGLTYATGGGYRDQLYGYYGAGPGNIPSPRLSVMPGLWNQLVLTKDSQTVDLYIDGRKVNSAEPVVQSVVVREWSTNVAPLRPNSAAYEIATAAVWTSALSADQVQALYQLEVVRDGAQSCVAPPMWDWVRAHGASRR